MKIFFSTILISLILLVSGDATAANGLVKNKAKMSITKPVFDDYYFVLMGDGCFHLARLNPPGYIDQYGNYFEGYSLTFVSSEYYEGTVSICPSDGTAYC